MTIEGAAAEEEGDRAVAAGDDGTFFLRRFFLDFEVEVWEFGDFWLADDESVGETGPTDAGPWSIEIPSRSSFRLGCPGVAARGEGCLRRRCCRATRSCSPPPPESDSSVSVSHSSSSSSSSSPPGGAPASSCCRCRGCNP